LGRDNATIRASKRRVVDLCGSDCVTSGAENGFFVPFAYQDRTALIASPRELILARRRTAGDIWGDLCGLVPFWWPVRTSRICIRNCQVFCAGRNADEITRIFATFGSGAAQHSCALVG
jgi:hypothetical protein